MIIKGIANRSKFPITIPPIQFTHDKSIFPYKLIFFCDIILCKNGFYFFRGSLIHTDCNIWDFLEVNIPWLIYIQKEKYLVNCWIDFCKINSYYLIVQPIVTPPYLLLCHLGYDTLIYLLTNLFLWEVLQLGKILFYIKESTMYQQVSL